MPIRTQTRSSYCAGHVRAEGEPTSTVERLQRVAAEGGVEVGGMPSERGDSSERFPPASILGVGPEVDSRAGWKRRQGTGVGRRGIPTRSPTKPCSRGGDHMTVEELRDEVRRLDAQLRESRIRLKTFVGLGRQPGGSCARVHSARAYSADPARGERVRALFGRPGGDTVYSSEGRPSGHRAGELVRPLQPCGENGDAARGRRRPYHEVAA